MEVGVSLWDVYRKNANKLIVHGWEVSLVNILTAPFRHHVLLQGDIGMISACRDASESHNPLVLMYLGDTRVERPVVK